MIFLNLLLLFVVLVHNNKQEEGVTKPILRKLTLGSVGIFCILIIAISYALYVTWAIQPFRLGPNALYADGVQGRYFTSLLPLLVPLFG